MSLENSHFNEHKVLHDLHHFLPAQAPLKDFVHHNTLHAFQELRFDKGLHRASEIFGYKVSLTLPEYRKMYHDKRINHEILDRIIEEKKGKENLQEWHKYLTHKKYDTNIHPRIGQLRNHWKRQLHVDMDAFTHPILFRVLCSYLDQGISIWHFPASPRGFLSTLRELEKHSLQSFFKTERAKNILLHTDCKLEDLLKRLVRDESLYERYIFDQQFSHQGWSGMVSAIEMQPETLLDKKKISLREFIAFELLLEIDALDNKFGNQWAPISDKLKHIPVGLFDEVHESELHEVMTIWQEAYEWSYYDHVLAGLKLEKEKKDPVKHRSFQALFCIDDRECSLRRYLEKMDRGCETFGTPGFFNVEFYYQPERGKFYTKLCPAPMNPKYLIKEVGSKIKHKHDIHFTKRAHSLSLGWLISQTLGFWTAFELIYDLFRPHMTSTTATSLRHMDKNSKLTINHTPGQALENNLQIGFTIEEMATRVEGLLKSIGLIDVFAPIVYVIGHGSSSVNNPHYAAYDCGACCGRPGSVNARVVSSMANNPEVRAILETKGIKIPKETQFIGGLHDTTRDEIVYFDEDLLSDINKKVHLHSQGIFNRALDANSKERSRRFESINTKLSAEKIHELVKIRSVSLFEPRPELNHATNALCMIGRRELTKGLFLDRRSFMNSYDYKVDPEGKYLLNILKAAAPVCGGINLEYFFSRVDNQKLGAGTKLPHNVMGLIGVANGIDGDLRPGLPSQMIEVHDPVRLLMVVEQFPDVILNTLKQSEPTYEWFKNEWIHLISIDPINQDLKVFKNGNFVPYHPIHKQIKKVKDFTELVEYHEENIPVHAY